MKKSPQEEKLEKLLQPSKFSACGFLGNDRRNLWEIIEADATEVAGTGKTIEEVARRMQELTDIGKKGLGDWMDAGHGLEVLVDDNRGKVPCPWPHSVRCLKRITTVKHPASKTEIRWSDLNIHLIKEHGFFEGRGARFRVEPRILIAVIFTQG
jgi:hypothetical protein